jgi:disulfide bond formation protein DsbB
MLQNHRIFFFLIFLYSLAIIGTVFFFQYGLKLPPCELCRYERWPYFALLIISLLGCFVHTFKRTISFLIIILFLISGGIGFFHVGVENHWINYNSTCVSVIKENSASLEEFKEKLFQKDLISCDVIKYKLFGLSFAAWNFISSVIMFIFSIIITKIFLKIPDSKY